MAATPTILLVDDDEPTRRILQRWLAHLGVRAHILEAEDGQQALAYVEAHCQSSDTPPALLVLLDLNMPVMDGLEFLENHGQLPLVCREGIPVIVLSGGASNAAEQARVRALAADVKFKPLDLESLAALVQQHLPFALPGS
ncbi:response regulator [Hymenobacter volaticus]|uniref:Response regulator n=1 Tax=Hymenobacter volaticus TaxID=2932254 RepID=A0ABY4GDL7_9BACT|nr:response regulator [Hymenobacter volaticus]UOQ68943.1 response regulator [Hymenobacter volaticus]